MNRYLHYFFTSGASLIHTTLKRKPDESYEEAVSRVRKDDDISTTPTAYIREDFKDLKDVQREFMVRYSAPTFSEGEKWNKEKALEHLAEEMMYFIQLKAKK